MKNLGPETVITGDCSIPLLPTDRSSRSKEKILKMILKYTINQMILIDIFRTFYPTNTCIFSAIHGKFFTIDIILGLKAILKKYKIEIISCIFADHNGTRL